MSDNKFKFNASLLEFNEVNSGFMKIKLSVMSEEIANNTHFCKEVIDKRLSGLNYIPVVLEYKEEVNDAGTHGGRIIIDDNGISYEETTKPYGVVIANTAQWEDIKQQNGELIPYITIQAYLWADRYDVSFINNGGINNQSMEVNILQSHYTDSCLEIDDFEFSALTILGKNVEPAFPNAKVITEYTKQDFEAEYNEMVKALSIYLNKEKEGQNLNEKLELFSKYNLTIEEIDFSIDELSIEELENKLKEFNGNKNSDTNPKPQQLDFSATYHQKYDALREAISTKNNVKRDEDDNLIEEYWYWVQDFDDEYVYTEQDHWTKDSYTNNIIRFSYTFDQVNLTATVGDDATEMVMTMLTKEEHDKIIADRAVVEQTYSKLQVKYDLLVEENQALVQFKEIKEKEEQDAKFEQEKAEKQEIFEAFSERLTSEEMQPVIDKIDGLSKDEIELQLFALVGKKSDDNKLNFNKNEKHKIGLFNNDSSNMSDGLKAVISRKKK